MCLLKLLLHSGWSVICPFGCGYIDALNEISLGGMVLLMKEACCGSPVQCGQIHHSHSTAHWVVAAKMTHLSTNKTSIIVGHHTDHEVCQCGC